MCIRDRLISIDLILYGSSLLLEFVALVALRLREPNLVRPFKAGSFPVACLLGAGPAVLIAYALYVSRYDKPVSYTHLDVYKRQSFNSTRAVRLG